MIFGIQFFVNGSVCAGLFFFCGKGRTVKGTPVRRVLPVAGGWLLGCRNSAKTASKILKLASEAAQTVRIFEATQISASQESAPLLQSPSTGSTRLTGWLFRAVVCVGAARELDEPSALRWTVGRRG